MPENHRSIVGCWEKLKMILLVWAFIALKTNQSMREKCPNTEIFLVRIQKNKDQKKLRIWSISNSEWYKES